MIESKDNEKLKLVRKLQAPKHRRRQGLFATEGEDLFAAGLAAGAEPQFVLVAAGTGLHGTDSGGGASYPVEVVGSDLLDSVSALGSGTRVIAVWPLPKIAVRISAIEQTALNASALPGLILRITAKPMKRPTIAPPQ